MQNRITDVVEHAVEAARRGYQPLPITDKDKRPGRAAWTQYTTKGQSPEELTATFTAEFEAGWTNLGVLTGTPSGGLVDVDLDHPATTSLKQFFLPPTPMMSGRASRPLTHYWYQVDENLPTSRQHMIPGPKPVPDESGYTPERKNVVCVELRSDKAQTLVPPSVHPDKGEEYEWYGEPWGGDEGPAVVDGRVLAVQVALLGLGSVLYDCWPKQGGRHAAYLALAGGLLRYGENSVHPYWERNAGVLIRALAAATHDEDGPETREKEVVDSTIAALKKGDPAVGFNRLSELLGEDHVKLVRTLVAEVESAAGFGSRDALEAPSTAPSTAAPSTPEGEAHEPSTSTLAPPLDDGIDPLEARLSTWSIVNLDPYLAGQVRPVAPTLAIRTDGQPLMYPGRVNMLFGASEGAKSWIALHIAQQQMAAGDRVLYLDLEDDPVNTIARLQLMGAGDDDIRLQFNYIRPEEPLAPMMRNRWGKAETTDQAEESQRIFVEALERLDPRLIIADGMTVLYGLHGLDANDAVSTNVITDWLKKLSRNGLSTVIVIDHTTKNADRGTMPIGSQHKVAMVQGTLLQAHAVDQPMPGRLGKVELIVLKDRPGQVRAASAAGSAKAQHAADVMIDSRVDGITRITMEPPHKAPPPRADSVEVDLSGSNDAERFDEDQEVKLALMRLYLEHPHELLKRSDFTGPRADGSTGLLPQYPWDRVVKPCIQELIGEGILQTNGKTTQTRYRLSPNIDLGDLRDLVTPIREIPSDEQMEGLMD